MQKKLKLIAYWMYLCATISIIGLYWSSGAFEIVISFALAALYYQAGTGILKVKDRDRIIAIVLLIISALGYLSIIISATTNSAQDQAELIAFIATSLLIISIICAYYLLTKGVVNFFKGDVNA